jgi:hypothetical protein
MLNALVAVVRRRLTVGQGSHLLLQEVHLSIPTIDYIIFPSTPKQQKRRVETERKTNKERLVIGG